MTVRYTYVPEGLPENRMRMYPTKVINIIGGPGSHKSLYSSAIVLNLHLRHKTVETIPDYAKSLVWQKDFEALRNQYLIAQQQYRMLSVLEGQVQYLVTECSLAQLLYYNETYPDNICDIAKTRKQILAWYKEFDNINVFVLRDSERPYVRSGRLQDEEQARKVDTELRGCLQREGLKVITLAPSPSALEEFANTLA